MKCHMAQARTMVDADITAIHSVTMVTEDAGHKTTVFGAEAAMVEPTKNPETVGHTAAEIHSMTQTMHMHCNEVPHGTS